jgi:amino-acid N-acetyltransferase
MIIVKATDQRRDQIINLLQSQKLPSEDLPLLLNDFYIALEEDKLIGVIGMERYSHYGLLRSMAVHPGYRNRHIAETLVNMLEDKAAATGITSMFLLTETAANYFERKGYDTITRDDVPNDLMGSSEFNHVCPESATVMKKQLIEHGVTVS